MVIFKVNVGGSALYFENYYRLSLGHAESFLRPLIYEDGEQRLFFSPNESIVQIIVEVVRMGFCLSK